MSASLIANLKADALTIPGSDAKLTNFASCRDQLKRSLILMRKSDASETMLGRRNPPSCGH
jgi:hypothetical protein